MKQFKRLGGDYRVGYHTEWKKNTNNRCIYCGEPALTREHIPSKAFLVEPFPDNLPTIPACFKCNNGYSSDEEYVSCYLDVLKEAVYDEYELKDKTAERLNHSHKLALLLEKQIQKGNNVIEFSYNQEKLINIIVKLARGHVGYEFDYVNFDAKPSVWYEFVFNMSEEQIDEFYSIWPMEFMPELGSRVYNRLCVIEEHKTGKILHTFLEHVLVQENQYLYNVYFENDNICVKIIIGEILYCKVKF